MPEDSASPLLSDDLHEIGTRVVDMLNQIGFLYRFPALAGVTLACITQHVGPLRKLLQDCEHDRVTLGRKQSSDGYAAGSVERADPLIAAYDYAVQGFRAFLRHLTAAVADSPDTSPAERSALAEICDYDAPDPQRILILKDLIDAHGEHAAAAALREFQPMDEQDWQGFRMVLFFFLLEIEKTRNH